MKYSFLTVLFSVVFLFSCKKDDLNTEPCITIVENSVDTIMPSDYLSTYPGSWWEYSNGQIDSCLSWEKIIVGSTSNDNGECTIVNQDIDIVPYTNFGYFCNESRVFVNSEKEITRIKQVVDTQIGVINEHSYTSGGGTQNSMEFNGSTYVAEIIGSMTVNGVIYSDVIRVEETRDYNFLMSPGTPTYYDSYYYAKDVGIIKKIIGLLGSYNYDTLLLENHYIAPH